MNTQSLYLTDPLTLKFEAEIQERLELPDGRLGVILSRTYFYPTGGGQAHDTGTLGNACVLDVVKSEDGEAVIHILDADPGEGTLNAEIDPERELWGTEAAMRALLGDVEGSLAILERYVLSQNVALDDHWWWDNLRGEPAFERLREAR